MNNGEWVTVEKSKKVKQNKVKQNQENNRRDSASMEGRNFERGRPQTILPNDDLTDEEEEEEDIENIILESPAIWNRFALIGEVSLCTDGLLMKHQITRCSQTECLDHLGNAIVNGNWQWSKTEDDSDNDLNDRCDEDLKNYSYAVGRQFYFISIIPRFTPRTYGTGKKLYFVHVRYGYYFLAERKPINALAINETDYFGFLGEKATHDPISLESDNVEDNKNNFKRIMKIVEGKMEHDKFQVSLEQEPRKDGKPTHYDPVSKEDLVKYKNNIYKCKLHLEDSYSGYGVILDEKYLERKIYLHNRRNCFQAFNGDIVNIMVFQQHIDKNKKMPNRLKGDTTLNEDVVWSGKVIEVVESNIKPVNKIFLCKLNFGDSNLMIPICKTIPVIEVDNKHAVNRVKKHCKNLIDGLSDVGGIGNLIQRQVKPEYCKKFANKCFVSLKELKENLDTSLKRLQYVDCYRCDYIFLVLYRRWNIDSRFPYGEIVGLYTPDVSFDKTLPLIAVSCDLSVVSVESEEKLNSEITQIKVEIKKKRQSLEKRQEIKKIIFSFKYINQPFNEVAYSYEKLEGDFFSLGVHIVNIEGYIKRDGLLDKYAMEQFFTFLLPICEAKTPQETKPKPHYLFNEALTNLFFSLKRNMKVPVISFYFIVNNTSLLIEGDPRTVFEQVSLNEEFDVEILDEIVKGNAPPYQYLKVIYETCMKSRIKRTKSHRIPPSWFNPDYNLKMNFCVFIISKEMESLVNEFVGTLLSFRPDIHFPVNVKQNILHKNKLNYWKIEVTENLCVKFAPTLDKLFNFESVFNNTNKNIKLSRQFLEKVSENKKINLFKCDMLFPDVSYYFYKLENIVEWNTIMAQSEARDLCFSISFTKPLSCFSDFLLQRILTSYFNGDFNVYNEYEMVGICDKYNDNKKIYEKYWNICRAYDIKDKFGNSSFILDCVYEDFNDSSIIFHHPFLRDVYHDNFILFESVGVRSVTLPTDSESSDVKLEWMTKIFIYDDVRYAHTNDKILIIKDIYLYDKKLWRNNLNSQEITANDVRIIDELKSDDKYPINLTSETTKYMDPKIWLSYTLERKQILKIQFNYVYSGGIMKVSPELLIANPHLKVCLCHRNDPFKYFLHPGELSKINYLRFSNLQDYKKQFRILNNIEGIEQTICQRQSYFIYDVKIDWIGCKSSNSENSQDDVYGVVILDHSWVKERFIKLGHINLRIQDPVNTLNKAIDHSKMEYVACIQSYLDDKKVYWLGHAHITDVAFIGGKKNKQVHITLKLLHSSFPIKPKISQIYTLEIMETPITARILDRSLRKLKTENSVERNLVERIVMKKISQYPQPDYVHINYDSEVLIKMKLPYHLNETQFCALNKALNQEFSLIWGPPGTGKTMVGCIIAFAFTQIHKRSPIVPIETVLYCGPSNQSVNVVAEKMMKTFEDQCPKMLRIFSSDVMNIDFPYPGAVVNNENNKSPEFIQPISLHYIIRLPGKPYAEKFRKYDIYFKENELRERIHRKEYSEKVLKYQKTVKIAFEKELKEGNYEIVLCTTVGACKRLLDNVTITQVIIDESGMCSEPEALGPILNKDYLKNTIFIGDHKQLRPIITSQAAQGKQLNLSLFERIYNPNKSYCTMLDKQYRMHPSICEFPSNFFYNEANSNLITVLSESWSGISSDIIEIPPSFNGLQYSELKGNYKAELIKNNVTIADNLWKGIRKGDFRCYPIHLDFGSSIPIKEKILFINVEGHELNQAVTGTTGNVKSKGNELEVKAVGMLYENLLKKIQNKRTASQSILIITQYRLQEHLLKNKCCEILEKLKVPGPPLVSTVIKSQGSECDYVIFSTVRSLPHRRDIDINPSSGWISKYLGFITDKNQFNVAITRAKKGLFLIGNSNLLSVNKGWKDMVDNLRTRGCFIDNIFEILS